MELLAAGTLRILKSCLHPPQAYLAHHRLDLGPGDNDFGSFQVGPTEAPVDDHSQPLTRQLQVVQDDRWSISIGAMTYAHENGEAQSSYYGSEDEFHQHIV